MTKVREEKGGSQPRKQKRPDQAADRLRERILEGGLKPGDRVPPEWIDPRELGVSRGSAREALKILEFQGMIASRTGPGGGVFVSSVRSEDAIRTIENLFLFGDPTISDIYAIRKVLEPELAASVAGQLSEDDFAALRETIRLYEDEPETAEEEYRQRMAELDFHSELARRASNRVLGFICIFMASLLRDMTVCREIYRAPVPHLRETGLSYQIRLIRAIKAGRADEARFIMRDHMIEAETYMLEMADIRKRGSRENEAPAQPRET
ncbi:FadR family transcriptional regulator [Pseudohoeflea suaedae]|uniref:FadR family transcriptional regulator n=1 Tax=Pseudohoeflea suaedae TaxID=877384 RepID=A0A4V3A729_9HYPH|nr:FCD domain-containing protein [Pseudohoeflea suaedae]TDH35962.1 FadR family transcriptional regulator [Pseudohoeflea suaedae]